MPNEAASVAMAATMPAIFLLSISLRPSSTFDEASRSGNHSEPRLKNSCDRAVFQQHLDYINVEKNGRGKSLIFVTFP
jgi:hypothetical protein